MITLIIIIIIIIISRLDRIKSGNCLRNDIKQQLRKKYNISRKGYQVVLEEVKQRLTAQAAKLKRYEDRGKFYNQNIMFESNQRSRFEDLEGEEGDNIIRDADENRNVWDSIWGKSTEHNNEAEWLKESENDLISVENQENIDLTVNVIEKQLRKCLIGNHQAQMACNDIGSRTLHLCLRTFYLHPIIICVFGTISRGFEKWLKLLEMPCSMEILQRVCLLGSGKILRKVLDT